VTALAVKIITDLGASPSTDHRAAGPQNCPAASILAHLTQGMVRGDELSYRAFHDEYVPRLRRYLLVITRGNEEAARECLQATLVKLVRHIRGFDDETQFWNWLTVLARTAYTDQHRKQSRYRAFLDRFKSQPEVTRQVSNENGQVDGQLLAALEQGLNTLTAEDQDLVQRKYLDRQSVRDIANSLVSTEKAVESRLGLLRLKLKAAVLTALQNE